MKTISCEDMIDIENASLEDVPLSRGTSKSSCHQDTLLVNNNNNENQNIYKNAKTYTFVLVLGAFVILGFIAWVLYVIYN